MLGEMIKDSLWGFYCDFCWTEFIDMRLLPVGVT